MNKPDTLGPRDLRRGDVVLTALILGAIGYGCYQAFKTPDSHGRPSRPTTKMNPAETPIEGWQNRIGAPTATPEQQQAFEQVRLRALAEEDRRREQEAVRLLAEARIRAQEEQLRQQRVERDANAFGNPFQNP